jgi:hypothetical protein
MCNTITKEEASLKKFYRALRQDSDVRTILTTGHWNPLSTEIMLEMYLHLSKGGVAALDAYIARLCQSPNPTHQRLATILLHDPPEPPHSQKCPLSNP